MDLTHPAIDAVMTECKMEILLATKAHVQSIVSINMVRNFIFENNFFVCTTTVITDQTRQTRHRYSSYVKLTVKLYSISRSCIIEYNIIVPLGTVLCRPIYKQSIKNSN